MARRRCDEEEMLEHGWHEYADKSRPAAPMPNDLPAIWELVIDDMESRDHVGTIRYGTRSCSRITDAMLWLMRIRSTRPVRLSAAGHFTKRDGK